MRGHTTARTQAGLGAANGLIGGSRQLQGPSTPDPGARTPLHDYSQPGGSITDLAHQVSDRHSVTALDEGMPGTAVDRKSSCSEVRKDSFKS